jgi:hypothetical protein
MNSVRGTSSTCWKLGFRLAPGGPVAADRALRDMVHVSVTALDSEREDILDPTLHSKLDVTPPASSRTG